MEILVCVKQVPDDYVEINLNSDMIPNVASVEKVSNAFDTYAVELAARHCEAFGGNVTVLSIGDESVKSNLKNLIAVGAKSAYVAMNENFADSDESGISEQLAQAIAKAEEVSGVKYDLIICGKESTDHISSQVGAMLAEKLNVGFVSAVVDSAQEGDKITVKQETEEGYINYELDAPSVITVSKPAYDPRYPSIKNKMAARKATIPEIGGITAPQNLCECKFYSEPEKRKAGIRIAENDAEEAVAKFFAKLDADKAI